MPDKSSASFMDPTVRRNRDWFGLCDYFIPSDEPWAGTYCKLLEGHDGPHVPQYPGSPPISRRERS